MKTKIKPCDCQDQFTVSKLNEQGIFINDNGITVEPNVVILKMGHTQVRIPMSQFKVFSDWYLTEQEIDVDFIEENNIDTGTR